MIRRVGFVITTLVVEFHLKWLVERDDSDLRDWRNKQENEGNELRARRSNFM